MEQEARFVPVGNPELREAGDGGGMPTIVGYIAPYNQWSPVYGGKRWGWREKIDPDFFESVMADDAVSLFNHDPNYALGRASAGNNKLERQEYGLWSETTPPDTNIIRELVIAPIRMGIIKGASFAFTLPDDDTGDDWKVGPDGIMERVLLKAERLYDTSPAVTQPWYPQTTAGIKDRATRSLSKREAESVGRVDQRDLLRLQNAILRLRAA
ncbi:MAG TPA: HK97 family phage prohead protease [Thermoanaerobaculia bacterium]|nr:HK97 family phage prohead protease [Thermoanaerobaculia bacterium]